MNNLIASLIGYFLGSIPFALVIGRIFYNTDIRQHGSGNLGGTNAGRVLGSKAAIGVIIFDVLKAAIAMIIVYFIDPKAMLFAGFFATIGHCFPIFANFKGGKAVSTAFGFLLSVSILITKNPLLHIGLPIVVFFVILYFTKMVSLASVVTMIVASIMLALTQSDFNLTLAFAIVTIIVVWRHRANLKRISQGEESKISWM